MKQLIVIDCTVGSTDGVHRAATCFGATEVPRKPHPGRIDLLTGFGAALDGRHTYEALVEKAVEPSKAARNALLTK